MFKDYYKILGISSSATAEEIKTAYRAMSIKWHPDKNPNVDVTSAMQDINEAYALLKDSAKRIRYDVEYQEFVRESILKKPTRYESNSSYESWDYDYSVHDETLNNDIQAARQYAKDLVSKFFKELKGASKDAAKGAWGSAKYYIFSIIAISFIGNIIRGFVSESNKEDFRQNSSEIIGSAPQAIVALSNYSPPSSWTKYLISNGAFSIYVPNTVELRNEYDPYTMLHKELGTVCNSDVVIFQQKSLGNGNFKDADKHYCRIMIQHFKGEYGDFLMSTQTEHIDYETKELLYEIAKNELGGYNFLEEPTYRWVDINGTKAIEINYRRNGNDGNTTACAIYLLQNSNEMVKMMVAYREQEKERWLPDMNNVIKTFKWREL